MDSHAATLQETTTKPRHDSDKRSQHRGDLMIGLLLFIALCAAVAFVVMMRQSMTPGVLNIFARIVVSVILSVIPVLICTVQGTSKARQLNKLNSLHDTPVFKTTYYRAARIGLDAVSPASLTGDYMVPIISFSLITASVCFMVLAAAYFPGTFEPRNVLLGGLKLVDGSLSSADLTNYQEGTFIVACAAFAGSYVYTLARLLERVDNNDLYPISLHYYSAHLVIGCLVATVLRHGARALGMPDDNGLLIILGFATGVAPDLIIITMLRRAFQAAKVFGSKDDPIGDNRPEGLPLLMLDGLTKEKVDRLNELAIDSAQALARQNPFVIWPRLPFDLVLLVDWIAQAQLYSLVKSPALKTLRARAVFNIFDLETRLSDAGAIPELCKALNVTEAEAPSLLAQLRDDPSFTRLREVRDALLVPPVLPKQ